MSIVSTKWLERGGTILSRRSGGVWSGWVSDDPGRPPQSVFGWPVYDIRRRVDDGTDVHGRHGSLRSHNAVVPGTRSVSPLIPDTGSYRRPRIVWGWVKVTWGDRTSKRRKVCLSPTYGWLPVRTNGPWFRPVVYRLSREYFWRGFRRWDSKSLHTFQNFVFTSMSFSIVNDS